MINLKIQYLLDRGLTLETIRKFKVGYVGKKKRDDQFFYERIIIPMYSHSGDKVLAKTGRTIWDIDDKYLTADEQSKKAWLIKSGFNKNIPKYKNSIFDKGSYLFNLNNLPTDTTTVVIFESQLDVMAFDQLGIANYHPVAVSGTALTQKHVEALLERGAYSIVLCMDGDKAGYQATKKAIELIMCNRNFVSLYVVSMPKNRDMMDLLNSRERAKKLFDDMRTAEQWLCDYYSYLGESNVNLLEFEKILNRFKVMYLPVVGESTYHRFTNNTYYHNDQH
jgi:DNA primase